MHRILPAILLSTLLTFTPATSPAAESFIEDFTSLQFIDTQNTTALVDTILGEARLQPFTFSSVGNLDTPGETFAVRFDGQRLIVADRHSGLAIYDIADPAAPQLLGASSALGDLWGIARNGNYIYCGDGYGHFKVIDYADPTTPTFLGHVSIPGSNIFCRGVACVGNTAYLAAGYAGLQIIDASNPAAPVIIGSYDSPGDAALVTVADGLAFLGDLQGGLHILDISNSSSPSLVSTISGSGSGAAKSGDYLFVNAGPAGLRVYDVSDPAAPTFVGGYATPCGNGEVAISGSIVSVAAEAAGVHVFDVADPSAPVLLATIPTYFAWGLDLSGTLLAIGDRAAGFKLVQALPLSGEVQSLSVAPIACPVGQVRLTPSQVDGEFNWQVSADGGADWTSVQPSEWTAIDAPGADLRWRADLLQTEFAQMPRCTDLTLEWVTLEAPSIGSVVDVPNDQGRRVRMSWLRACYDAPDDDVTITGYAIWRRIDDLRSDPSGLGQAPMRAGERAYPPGEWDYVTTVPARGEEQYNTIVPTLCDSTASGNCLSTFFVSALTPDPLLYFDSEPASGYSVDNLSPAAPLGLTMPVANLLRWDEVVAEDLWGYRVYFSEDASFADYELLGSTSETQIDVSGSEGMYLAVRARDFAGNESGFSVFLHNLTAAGDSPAPAAFVLQQNMPNPFNPSTTIRFGLPETSTVSLTVFDVSGRCVRSLLSRERVEKGWRSVIWDGKDASGSPVSSGIYLYRLDAGPHSVAKTMALIK